MKALKPKVPVMASVARLCPQEYRTLSAIPVLYLLVLCLFMQLMTFESPRLKDTVVIEPTWLLTGVVGQLCSPEFFPQPHINFRQGKAQKEDVVKSLSTSHQPGIVVLDMLAQLGLCIIDGDDVIVPSKLDALERGQVQIGGWLDDPELNHYAGVRFTCEESIPLSAGFVVLLQTRVFSEFKRHQHKLPKLFLRCANVYPCQSDVQGTVVVHPTRLAVDIVVRGPDSSQRDLYALIHIMCEQIRDVSGQYSPGTVLRQHILSSSELSTVIKTQRVDFPRITYRPADVHEAVRGNQMLDHPLQEGKADRALSLLHLPPTHIHLISKESLDSLCALLDSPSDRNWKHYAEVLGFEVREIFLMDQKLGSKTKHMLESWATRSPNNTLQRLLDCFESVKYSNVEAAKVLREESQKVGTSSSLFVVMCTKLLVDVHEPSGMK